MTIAIFSHYLNFKLKDNWLRITYDAELRQRNRRIQPDPRLHLGQSRLTQRQAHEPRSRTPDHQRLTSFNRRWSRPSRRRWTSTREKFQFSSLRKRPWRASWPWKHKMWRNLYPTSWWGSKKRWRGTLLTRRPRTRDFNSRLQLSKERRLRFSSNCLVRISHHQSSYPSIGLQRRIAELEQQVGNDENL